MSEGELDRIADARFPALTRARDEVAKSREFSVRYSQQLDAVDEKFKPVYDIPVSGLPLTVTPWLFVLGGLASLLAGLAALHTRRRAPLIAILMLGTAMVVGPLALAAPSKSADGEDVKDFASRGLTTRAATAAQKASATLDAVVRETDGRALAYLARRQGVAGSRIDRELERDFPQAAKFLAEWDVLGPRLSRLADAVSASVEDFESAKRMPIAFLVWLLLGTGLALSVGAGIALLRERRETPGPRMSSG